MHTCIYLYMHALYEYGMYTYIHAHAPYALQPTCVESENACPHAFSGSTTMPPEVVFQRAGGDVFDISFSTPPQKSSVVIDEIFAESAKNAPLPAGGHAISKLVFQGHNLNGRNKNQNIS